MPELPEVETVRRSLRPHLLQSQVERVTVRQPQLRWQIPKTLASSLPKAQLNDIERRGKYLLFRFSTGTMISHLGMSGRLYVVKSNALVHKHDHVDIQFQHGLCLRYTDPRRFGAMLWTTQCPFEHRLIQSIGVEPLSKVFNGNYLYNACAKSRSLIKQLIMNARIVAGVGNIYANEALFHARIHPLTVASQLRTDQCAVLVSSD